jgi:hypothetical protein
MLPLRLVQGRLRLRDQLVAPGPVFFPRRVFLAALGFAPRRPRRSNSAAALREASLLILGA